MVITNQQEAENFVLSYLETHQEFLDIIWQKFPLRKVKNKKKLPIVDAETDERIGQALAEKGQGVVLTTKEEINSFLASITVDR
jgi:hypothetical protein